MDNKNYMVVHFSVFNPSDIIHMDYKFENGVYNFQLDIEENEISLTGFILYKLKEKARDMEVCVLFLDELGQTKYVEHLIGLRINTYTHSDYNRGSTDKVVWTVKGTFNKQYIDAPLLGPLNDSTDLHFQTEINVS